MGFPRRPHRSRQYRPRTTVTWSWPTYGATWQAWTAAPRGLRPLRKRRRGRPWRRKALPPARSARRHRHCCWHRQGRRSQGRTAGPRHLRSQGRTAGPRHLRSRHAGPRAQPTGGPAPPDRTYATIAETTAVQAPVEEAARPTAGPTAPQSGTTGAGRRSAPPSAEPPPLEVETVPLTAGITAPVVARPGRPPGRAGSDEAPTTGAGTAFPARIPLGAGGMMRQIRGAGRSGSPVRLPTPNPRMYRMSRGTSPRASGSAITKKADSLRRSRPRAPRTGYRCTL